MVCRGAYWGVGVFGGVCERESVGVGVGVWIWVCRWIWELWVGVCLYLNDFFLNL